MNLERKFWDKSTKLLVFSNLIIIVFALFEGWNLINVLWVYWFQNLIIGYFNYKRILKLKDFTTKNLEMNDQPVSPTEKSKKIIAVFFLVHYGLFHFCYFIFLVISSGISFINSYLGFSIIALISFIVSIITFYYNHKTSFQLNYQEDLKGKVNIGTLMFMPYARIIPMHLIILFGSLIMISGDNPFPMILFFLSLKTIADVIMHKVEHNFLRKNIIKNKPEMVVNN